MPPAEQSASLLLALPEPLLLAVLQFLTAADDLCSLFSAARAHSRLHQAAVTALGSVSVLRIQQQQALDSVLVYLGKHGQHVRSVDLAGLGPANDGLFWRQGPIPPAALRQLPPLLQLHSLQLFHLKLQLLPGAGYQGVLGPAADLSALKQLRLKGCVLHDSRQGLAAALAQLPPGLQHLGTARVRLDDGNNSPATFPMSSLQGLQQLTFLELWEVRLQADDPATLVLQPLQALSRLVDLRLAPTNGDSDGLPTLKLSASMLAAAAGLTHLQLQRLWVESDVLAGKTQLQHLQLSCWTVREAAWTAELLSHLGPLQQLTHLELCENSRTEPAPPAAYSALTASSKLQQLCISYCTLPAGVWQHVFPEGKQLPHLTSLEAAAVRQQTRGGCLPVPEGSRLVSCCPGLRSLNVEHLTHSAGAIAALQGLSGLTQLECSLTGQGEALGEVCQLTQLRALSRGVASVVSGRALLQTTQLRQLTRLKYNGPHDGRSWHKTWVSQASGDEPVWRQVLRAHLDHSDTAVAQAAAAALAAE